MALSSSHKLDWLNILLIFIALALAYLLPFSLFLVAYAVLGPLHYLTEIHWLKSKGFFVENRSWPWAALIASLGIALPLIVYNMGLFDMLSVNWLKAFLSVFREWTNSLIFLALASSISFVMTKNNRHRWITIGIAIIIAIALNYFPLYVTVVGLLIPTIIHVFLFTVLFMLYGALKNRSKPGYLSVAIMCFVAVFIALLPIESFSYLFADSVKETIIANKFYVLNTRIREILGLSDGKSFYFYEAAELKVQVFITFAYVYHYLNWFSKTTVIGWHRQLTKRSSVAILLLWTLCLSAFWYDYKVGFYTALSLSFLHVLLEFPVNVISVKESARYLWRMRG